MITHSRETIRLPDDLYDTIEAMAQPGQTVQDFVEQAARFWVGVAESGGPLVPKLTADQELLARRLLYYLAHTEAEEAQAIFLLMRAFEKRERRSP